MLASMLSHELRPGIEASQAFALLDHLATDVTTPGNEPATATR